MPLLLVAKPATTAGVAWQVVTLYFTVAWALLPEYLSIACKQENALVITSAFFI